MPHSALFGSPAVVDWKVPKPNPFDWSLDRLNVYETLVKPDPNPGPASVTETCSVRERNPDAKERTEPKSLYGQPDNVAIAPVDGTMSLAPANTGRFPSLGSDKLRWPKLTS